MAKNLTKTDWWIVNGWLGIVAGLLTFLGNFSSGDVLRGLFVGGVGVLFGVGFLQRSMIVFWLAVVAAVYEVLTIVLSLDRITITLDRFGSIVQVVALIMLWQQIRRKKGKK